MAQLFRVAEGEQDGSGSGTPESWREQGEVEAGQGVGRRGGLRLPCVTEPPPSGALGGVPASAGHVPVWAAETSLLGVRPVTSWLPLRRPAPCLWLLNSYLSAKA